MAHLCVRMGLPVNTNIYIAQLFSIPASATWDEIFDIIAFALVQARMRDPSKLPLDISMKDAANVRLPCFFQWNIGWFRDSAQENAVGKMRTLKKLLEDGIVCLAEHRWNSFRIAQMYNVLGHVDIQCPSFPMDSLGNSVAIIVPLHLGWSVVGPLVELVPGKAILLTVARGGWTITIMNVHFPDRDVGPFFQQIQHSLIRHQVGA